MQIVENSKFVKGRVKLGNTSHMVSLVLLVAGFLLSLLGSSFGPEAIYVAYAALIAALLLLNYGRTYTKRWAPKFRQDGLIAAGLRGLDNQHTLFNFPGKELPDHVLVGPTGLYLFVPRFTGGRVGFDGLRWSRGSMAGTLLRNVVEGAMGNPITDLQKAASQLARYLQTNAPPEVVLGLEARLVIVFTNPTVQLEVRNSEVPVLRARDLKSLFRKAKPTLTPEKVDALRKVLSRDIESEE